jgi:hypothetical protein
MQQLHDKRVTWQNTDEIQKAVRDLQVILPQADRLKLQAAVDLRLRRLDALKRMYDLNDVPVDTLYGLLISRAVELGDGNAGVIPMFDMINHNPVPNLSLSFDGENFELVALRDIAENEEVSDACLYGSKLYN